MLLYVFLSEEKHLLMSIVQSKVSIPVTLKFALHSAIVTIVQKNIALMVMDTTPIKH